MNRRYIVALLVIGIALAFGSSTLDFGGGLSSLGVALAIFAAAALVWSVVRQRRGV